MALVIETGAIVTGANTFASVAQLDAFAALRGITIAGDTAAKEVLLIKAMDYIEAQERRFKGYRRKAEQPLSWPRTHVVLYYTEQYRYINGYENVTQGQYFPDDAIPEKLIAAQCQLAIDVQTVDLLPTVTPDSRDVQREKVGPIETTYFAGGQRMNSPLMARAEALLEALCGATAFGLRLSRA